MILCCLGRCADSGGDGKFREMCKIPFTDAGTSYDSCTTDGNNGVEWCSTKTDQNNNHLPGFWGNCAPLESADTCEGNYCLPFYQIICKCYFK